MRKEEHTILYCTILSAGQWDFLLDCKAAINRQKCLYRLMTAAVRTKTVLHIKGVEIALEVGQAAASDVEQPHFHTHPAFPYGVVCGWCPFDQSPLCQACGCSQRTD